MMKHWKAAIAVAAITGGALAAPFATTAAHATTFGGAPGVSVDSFGTVSIVDFDGESINLYVQDGGGSITIHSTVKLPRLSPGKCGTWQFVSADPRPWTITCSPLSPTHQTLIDLGDRNDKLVLSTAQAGLVAGGAGDDNISVSGGGATNRYQVVRGDSFGEHSDDGNDTIRSYNPLNAAGGGGNDTLVSCHHSAVYTDFLAGDSGFDVVRAQLGQDTVQTAEQVGTAGC